MKSNYRLEASERGTHIIWDDSDWSEERFASRFNLEGDGRPMTPGISEFATTTVIVAPDGAAVVVERVDEYLPDCDNDLAVEWDRKAREAREAREEIVKTALEVLAGTRQGTSDAAYSALCALIEAGSAYSDPVEEIEEPDNRDTAIAIAE